jgi:hypothetical protein
VITSRFTRASGYTNIETTTKKTRNELKQILRKFTPQGASPQSSIKIQVIQQWLGISYFVRFDPSTYKIMILLTELKKIKWKRFVPLIHEKLIPHLACGDVYKLVDPHVEIKQFYLQKIFGIETTATILYSLLCGDNIVIIHPEHSARLKFIVGLLQLVPSILWSYNRITSNCEELEGNENIAGLKELPKKYYSHKKVYLPLDTIFIDLKSNTVHGEGIKNSEFTKKIVDTRNPEESFIRIRNLMKKIQSQNKISNKDMEIIGLIHRIELKLGLRSSIIHDWMMF